MYIQDEILQTVRRKKEKIKKQANKQKLPSGNALTEVCFVGLMVQVINMTINKWHFIELLSPSKPLSQTTLAFICF